MGTKLDRIAEISKENANMQFTSIYHLIDKELLIQCHKELDKDKAVGVDGICKEEYGKDLEENINDLLRRLKNKSYKPLPTLRTYIPKSNGKQRPLGIASYEDKIVMLALKKLVEAVFEPRFLDAMYRFRPNRGCHEALKAVNYMLVLWFYKEVRPRMKGQSFLVAYADDFVCCFQNKWEAETFYGMLKERLNTYGLELEETKSQMIEFGRFAEENTKDGKPDTFDFLGFTHYCGKSQKGRFRVKRKTSKKKFREKTRNFKDWIKGNRNMPLKELMPKVKAKLIGHYNYYGITDNFPMINQYFNTVTYLIFKWLNRRSQKKGYNSQGFNEMLKYYPLPTPSIRVNIYER